MWDVRMRGITKSWKEWQKWQGWTVRQIAHRTVWKKALAATLVSLLAFPLHLQANPTATHTILSDFEARASEINDVVDDLIAKAVTNPDLRDSALELKGLMVALENSDHTTTPKIPDPYHLTDQYLYVPRAGGNTGDRYHLAGTDGGLPPTVPRPDAVTVVKFGSDGVLGIAYKDVVHAITSLKVKEFTSDMELLVCADEKGQLYVMDMVFARTHAFKAPLPVHKLATAVDIADLRLNFLTRGFSPFTHEINPAGELVEFNPDMSFVAGDLAIWKQDREGRRILIDLMPRNYLIAEINNGNSMLAAINQALRGNVDPISTPTDLDDNLASLSIKSKKILQNIESNRIQRMLAEGVAQNNMRDSFTYSKWQRDYLTIRNQAKATVAELEDEMKKFAILKDMTKQKLLENLKKSIANNDFSTTWYLMSTNRRDALRDMVTDKIIKLRASSKPEDQAKAQELSNILSQQDYQKLWDNPKLYTGSDSYQNDASFHDKIKRGVYQQLTASNMKFLASNILTAAGLAGAGIGAAYLLSAGFSIKQLWPNILKQKNLPTKVGLPLNLQYRYNRIRPNYRRYAVAGILFGLAIIPLVGILGSMSASATGNDWDFRKQLNLIGMRVFAAMALPIWHYLSRATGQELLLPSLAAGLSPTTRIDGTSPLGKEIGLDPDESVRIGMNMPNPFDRDAETEQNVMRRNAISILQQQGVRAQAIGWEIARLIVIKDFISESGTDPKNIEAFKKIIADESFQKKWKVVATGLESEVMHLYTKLEVYNDLRSVTTKQVFDFLAKTKPQVLESDYHIRASKNILHNARNGIKNTAWGIGKFFSTMSLDYYTYLIKADPDDFVSSYVWQSFMFDFVTVIIYEGLYGVRSRIFGSNRDLSELLVTRNFPFWHRHHKSEAIGQVYAHNVVSHGRYSLVFGTLNKVRETNYQPLDTLFVAGEDKEETYLEGVADVGKALVNVTEVDYSHYFIKTLLVGLSMIQIALLFGFIAKPFLAKQPMGAVMPIWLTSFFWAQWAFAWPWTLLYGSAKHREGKHEEINHYLMQTKLTLHRALNNDDTEAMRSSYYDLVDIYAQHSSLPSALIRDVRGIEKELGIEDGIAADDLMQFIGLLLQMQDASPAAKRKIYRQITEHLETGTPYRVSREGAQRLIAHVKVNPPFPTELSSWVSFTSIASVAILTTVLASPFMAKIYHVKTYKAMLPYAVKGTAIYATLWAVLNKKNINSVWGKVRDTLGVKEVRRSEAQEDEKQE